MYLYVVGDEGVQAVNGGELLCEREGNAVVVGMRAGDAAYQFAGAYPPDELGHPLRGEAPPVSGDSHLHDRVPQYRRGPLDGVYFSHEGSVDEPGGLEKALVRPIGVF